MSQRQPDQSDFDLDTFIGLFDEALTSEDPRVKRALQDLLIITTLVRSNDNDNQGDLFNNRKGPLRRLFDDVHNINRRLTEIEHDKTFRDLANQKPGLGVFQPITVKPNTVPYPYDQYKSYPFSTDVPVYTTMVWKDSTSDDGC